MLQLTITPPELFDERTNEFIQQKSQTIQLEHSLVSISKWESKYRKPFLSKDKKTNAETLDYIRCMIITQNVSNNLLKHISNANIDTVNSYIEINQTATTFPDTHKGLNNDIITSEVIYYWMVAHQIPFECQKWHLSRLLTLINVCNLKNAPAKKMASSEIMARNKALNEKRKKEYNSRG